MSAEELTEKCMKGLLIHDYGAVIIKANFGKPSEIKDLDVLKERIYKSICMGKSIGELYV